MVLAEPVVVFKGDHFILRRPSPGTTIGGGVVVDARPARRRRRRDPGAIGRLETLARGTPPEILLQTLDAIGPVPLKEAIEKAGLDQGAAEEALVGARASGDLVELGDEGLLMARSGWQRFESTVRAALAAYHAAHPLRPGMPREELKSRLAIGSPRVFSALAAHAAEMGWIVAAGSIVRLPAHAVQFSPAQQRLVDALLADFRRDPYNTPSVKDAVGRLGAEVLGALLDQGVLVQISPDVLLLADIYAAMVDGIRAHLQAQGKITVAEVRDLFATSRKYALALMEYLDSHGLTRRIGDERVLRG